MKEPKGLTRAMTALAIMLAIGLLLTPVTWAQGRCGDPAQRAWCNVTLSADQRAGLLLGALTDDEKISLLAGDDVYGVVGSGAHSHTGTSDGVARVGLPATYYSDGPVGPRQGSATAMPVPMALAATFDAGLAQQHGAVVANEARFKGNDVVFGPTVNIMRTPLGGRTFEAYGEDPFLTTRLTVGWIEGAQSQGVIANVKHFAANNQEGAGPAANGSAPGQPLGPPPAQGDRLTVNSIVDDRTLHEIYLPQFEAAVKEAHVGSVMCSYNRLGGQYACENTHLLTDILKHDWGFPGYVLSDYGAAHNTVASLNDGLDFEPWPGFVYGPAPVRAALASGMVRMSTVDEHVRRILRTLFAFGFFDRGAYRDDDSQIDQAAHAQTAQRIEESATTLLKNDGTLPLDPARLRSIAVIGKQAVSFVTGGGSGAVTPFSFVSPLQGIAQRAGPGVKVVYQDGSNSDQATVAARAADVAIVFAGDYETEGSDRQCLSLECPNQGDQDGLIAKIAAANPHTVVVLETGGPVLTPWRDRVGGLLEAWYPGERGGAAIARVLFGDTDPAGRLPVTFPSQEGDIPTAGDPAKYPGVAENVTYREGVLVGYRWYDAHNLRPAFPFGYGLSYTSFAYGDLRVVPTPGRLGAQVSAAVTNTGRRPGVAVAQLYLALPAPRPDVPQPPRQLRGFAKLGLAAGQTRRVAFDLDLRSFSYWDVRSASWRAAPGCYRALLGGSSRNLVAQVTLAVGALDCGLGAVSLGLPTARRPAACISRRAVLVHVRGVRGARVRRLGVFVDHRRQQVRIGPRRTVRIDLTGRRRGRVHVRIVVRTRGGRRVVDRRAYRTCTRRRRGSHRRHGRRA